METHTLLATGADGRDFDEAVVAQAQVARAAARPPLTSAPMLAAVRRAGTAHIYADTADVQELGNLIATANGAILLEVDGNTANQPLVHKVIGRYLETNAAAECVRELRHLRPNISQRDLTILLYAVICGRSSNDIVQAFAAGRQWEVSLQLHMALSGDAEAAMRAGRALHRMVPSGFVKIPFSPQAPHCLLVARDLEGEGIPVNFTSTFSARQAVVAALLADVTRTNIFMGRLNQGLKAVLLGEHVDLEAQRALLRVRRDDGIKTQLIVASVREWQTFVRVAGCDVFTAPCEAIAGLLQQTDVAPDEVRSQLETSYEDRLGIAADVSRVLSPQRIARLYAVEPELIEFLRALRRSRDYQRLTDGDELFRRFEQAGFGDVFYAPSAPEWEELRKNKLPDLKSELAVRLPIDTLYTLLADADFEKYQEDMDKQIAARLF
jgi:transaldolase